MSEAPRAVICDFGGVLTTPLIEAFAAYQRESGVGVEALAGAMQRRAQSTGRHPLHELERGQISEAEFLAALEEALGDGTRLNGFRETYFQHLHPNRAMIDLMAGLRARGLRMALLTNNVREWEPHWRAKLPELEEIFEVVVDSAFVGLRKPEPEIYELTVARLGDLRADQCLFVDDNDVNCRAARALGMSAVRFLDTEQATSEIEAALGAG
jgi:putative hydrolase of the HAD superfamily